MRILVGLLLVVSVGACALEEKPYRSAVTSFFDPVCAPDGSVVRIEFANSKGSYGGINTSHEYCPWNK